jgi:hypothetical protein
MKTTLEFSLPDDESEFRTALDGYKWKLIVQDLDQHLRSRLRHDEMISFAESSTLLQTRSHLHSLLEREGLFID